MDVALAKLFLDAIKQLSEIFSKSSERHGERLVAGTYLELYGSCLRLRAFVDDLQSQRSKKAVPGEYIDRSSATLLNSFFGEVEIFAKKLTHLNIEALSAAHPALAGNIRAALREEVAVTARPGAAAHVSKLWASLPKRTVRDEFSQRLPRIALDPEDRPAGCGPTTEYWEAFDEVARALEELDISMSAVIRSTWTFKELAKLPSAKR